MGIGEASSAVARLPEKSPRSPRFFVSAVLAVGVTAWTGFIKGMCSPAVGAGDNGAVVDGLGSSCTVTGTGFAAR